MAGPFVATVVILCIPREEFSHDSGDALFAAPEENVHVIAHECPRIYRALPVSYRLAQPFQESGSIVIVVEDVGFVDAPNHDVMQRAGDIKSGLSRHAERIGEIRSLVKFNVHLETTSLSVFLSVLRRSRAPGYKLHR